ncbi:MAG: hypothetical protein H6745_01515 [Deltaproteobacteria bacterium]|nr:hypothetical protein [Deltaproteobacteria bacterium]
MGDVRITADEVAALVIARFEDGGQAPGMASVQAATEDLVDRAILVKAARDGGFAGEGVSDEDAVAAYLAKNVEEVAKAAVTTDDIQRYWEPTRRAQALVYDDREVASQAQIKLLEATAATPEKAEEIVADFRVEQRQGQPGKFEPWTTTEFGKGGLSRLGEPVAPLAIARGAFAVKTPGAVSPPIPTQDGKWVLVQALPGQAGIDPAVLTPENLEEARREVAASRSEATATKLMIDLREKAQVKIDPAQVQALAKRLTTQGDHVVRAGTQRRLVQDMRKWRMTHLRGFGRERLPGVGDPNEKRAYKPGVEEVQKKMGATTQPTTSTP